MLHKLSISILPLTIGFILASCALTKKDSDSVDSVETYKKLAIDKYKDSVTYRVNSTDTHVLCYQQSKPILQSSFPRLQFFVYDLKNEKVLFEDSLANARIKWLNDDQIQISTIPGIVTGDEEADKKLTGYIYDIKLQRKLYDQGDKVKYAK